MRIYGRQISITDYGDCRTKEIIGKTKQRTFVLIKPSAMEKLGDVIADIESRDFQVCMLDFTLLLPQFLITHRN